MEKGLVALQSAEMLPRRALRVAVGVAGRDVETIEQPQAILQIGRRLWLPVLLWQSSPKAGEGVAPGLLAAGQIQALEGLLHSLVRREAGPLMPPGLHRLLRLLEIAQGLL